MLIEIADKHQLFNDLCDAVSAADEAMLFLDDKVKQHGQELFDYKKLNEAYQEQMNILGEQTKLDDMLRFIRDESWYDRGTKVILEQYEVSLIQKWKKKGIELQ